MEEVEIEGWGNLLRQEKLAGWRGNGRVGKPVRKGKVGRMEGKWKDGETC